MFISGLGEVKGSNAKTKLCVSGTMVRARDLDDQTLSLLVPALFRNDPICFAVPGSDNRRLRKRLQRSNPNIKPNLHG